MTLLTGESMFETNTREDPERIVPETSNVSIKDGRVELEVDPYSMIRLRIPLAE
jgi:alpha-N-arabinofuranosidase